jgi:hypothetical protein
MSIQWRQLFDALNIQWRDKGPNTSYGHINISCCWCSDDPSYHLAIKEDTGEYYCLRSSGLHAGRSAPWLLKALGVASEDIDQLLQDYSDGYLPTASVKPVFSLQNISSYQREWDYYEPATSYPEALDYLYTERGYKYPELIVEKYNLRFAKNGRFAGRILFPLSFKGQFAGFTGRSVRNQHPKYLTYALDGAMYVPEERPYIDTLLPWEGPFDSLSIALAVFWVKPVAWLGLALGEGPKLSNLIYLTRNIKRVLIGFDQGQSTLDTRNVFNIVQTLVPDTQRVTLPESFNDPGAMSSEIITDWLEKYKK